MKKDYYAHSISGRPPEDWQPLDVHLKGVAKLADEFSRSFGGSVWARILGAIHDIGKGTLPWQAYLRHENEVLDEFNKYYVGRIEHSAQGAQWVYERSKDAGKLLAYCIAGHHGGLRNWEDSRDSALRIS